MLISVTSNSSNEHASFITEWLSHCPSPVAAAAAPAKVLQSCLTIWEPDANATIQSLACHLNCEESTNVLEDKQCEEA